MGNEMNTYREALTACTDRLRLLQEKQSDSLNREAKKNIAAFRFEQAAAFMDLRNTVDMIMNAIHNHGGSPQELDDLRRLLEHARDSHREFRETVDRYHKELKHQLGTARKTRTGLHGYASAGRNRNRTMKIRG